jgi:hypothetical protein
MSDEKRTGVAEVVKFGPAYCMLARSCERRLRVSNRARVIVMTYAAIDALGVFAADCGYPPGRPRSPTSPSKRSSPASYHAPNPRRRSIGPGRWGPAFGG